MKIATFVNVHQEVVSFFEKGTACLCENLSGGWTIKLEIPLEITKDMGLTELNGALKEVASQLKGCRIFLLGESKGVFRILLEEQGFRTWISEGSLFEQLDNVARKDVEISSINAQRLNSASAGEGGGYGAGCSRSPRNASGALGIRGMENERAIPQPLVVGNISDGYYRINLAEALNSDPDLNSKQILIPFFKETAFRKLEVFCDHLPRWFSRELNQLALGMEPELPDVSGQGIKVIICPNTCSAKKRMQEERIGVPVNVQKDKA